MERRRIISSSQSAPTAAKYAVWNSLTRNGINHIVRYGVGSPRGGAALIDELVQEQLADPTVAMNAFGLEALGDNGEWCEWYDEEGRDVDHAFGSMKEVPA